MLEDYQLILGDRRRPYLAEKEISKLMLKGPTSEGEDLN